MSEMVSISQRNNLKKKELGEHGRAIKLTFPTRNNYNGAVLSFYVG